MFLQQSTEFQNKNVSEIIDRIVLYTMVIKKNEALIKMIEVLIFVIRWNNEVFSFKSGLLTEVGMKSYS